MRLPLIRPSHYTGPAHERAVLFVRQGFPPELQLAAHSLRGLSERRAKVGPCEWIFNSMKMHPNLLFLAEASGSRTHPRHKVPHNWF